MFSSGVSYVFSGCQRRIRVVLERSVVESAGLFANETWLEQYIDAMKAFSVDRDDASVCELSLSIDLSSVSKSTTMWHNFSIKSWAIRLSAVAVREHSCHDVRRVPKIHMKEKWHSRRRKARYFFSARVGGCQLVHRPQNIFFVPALLAFLMIAEDEVDISSFRSSAAARSADLASASRFSLRRAAKGTSCNEHVLSTQASTSVVAIVGVTATSCSSMTCGTRASTICSSMLCWKRSKIILFNFHYLFHRRRNKSVNDLLLNPLRETCLRDLHDTFNNLLLNVRNR